MPNDAKLGLFLGLVIVIALAVLYRGKEPAAVPETSLQAPKQLATPTQSQTTAKPQSETMPTSSSLPGREKLRGDKLSGKEDPSQRVNGNPDTQDQESGEKNRT